MRDSDAIELVARLRDLGLPSAAHERTPSPGRRMLLDEIARERRGRARPRPPRRRPRVALVVALVVGVFGAGGVGYAALSLSDGPELASAGIGCHQDRDLDGSLAVVQLAGERAIDTCAAIWRSGAMSAGARRVPPLVACVEPRGGRPIHVFPSSDPRLCARYSMVSFPAAGIDPNALRFARFRRELDASYPSRCVFEPEARRLVRAALERHGYGNWRIEAVPSPGARGCTSPAFDSDSRVVFLLTEG